MAETEQDPQKGAQGAAGPPSGDPVDQTSDVQALRHEAASRRRALRAVEAERDTLLERLDARDRAEVEAIASNALADPSDFTGAVDLDALRGEDGAVDFDRVQASIGELLRAKPHYALQTPRVNLHQGARQAEPEPKSFGQALKRDGGR
jgi:hypothetical protein